MSGRCWLAGAIVLLAAVSMPSVAEDPPLVEASTDEELADEVTQRAREFVERCEITLAGNQKLTLHPQPILRWSNPTAGRVFGDVYLWTDRGRPAAVASYYKFFSPNWGRTLEVSSLTDKRLAAEAEGVRFWTPSQPGLTFQWLGDDDSPASASAARLVQMRRLAANFKVQLMDKRNRVGNAGVSRELRMLSQPVYRYPPPKADGTYLDGAVFAFVEGTDPELLLLLEAVQNGDHSQWRYGLGRTNRDELRVNYREQTVWAVPHIVNVMDRPRETYTLLSLEHPLRASGK